MPQLTFDIPAVLAELPQIEQERLLRAGLYEAVHARIAQVETAIAATQKEVSRLEEQYGVSLSAFESEILPDATSQQAHEDYNDWYFWTESLRHNGDAERPQSVPTRSDGNK